MNSNYCVYRHRRLDNNKIFYVGISSNNERPYHKNCNSSGLMNPIKLIDLITLNIYNSIKEASEILNIKQSTLTHYILGTRKNKTNLIKLEEYEKNYN